LRLFNLDQSLKLKRLSIPSMAKKSEIKWSMSSLQILEGKKIDMEQAFREYKIKDKQSAKSKRKEENKILKARSVKKEKKLVTQEIFVKIDSKGRDVKKR